VSFGMRPSKKLEPLMTVAPSLTVYHLKQHLNW
jgi:hypothetical protein